MEKGELDLEAWRWTDVMPGDVVQSKGTYAYRQRDFIGRDDDTPMLTLHSSPVLVLARIPGIPGERPDDLEYNTFVCLSRHGLIIVAQSTR